MIFLHPIWFFALAAISIPVAIHLWNIRKGKTLKVGSIALITAASRKKTVSRRLSEILLLLLRCLLLILIAFILTMPFWNRSNNASKKGWLLIPKEDIKEAYQKFKPRIDSLTKAGFEFHYFDRGFVKVDLYKALADTAHYQNKDASYWTLVQQLNGRTPPSLSVYIFTANGVTHFTGEKPQVSLNLHWQTYTSADSAGRWIEKAWLTNSNDIEVVEGNSNSTGTSYKNYSIRSGDQSTSYAVHSDNGKLSIGLKNSNEQIAVDTSTWRFAIYADKNGPDAGYLKAALQSIIQFTNHKAGIKQYSDVNQIPSKQNWLFWLSVKPISQQFQYDNLFVYANGKINHSNSWVEAGTMDKKIELYKSISANDKGFSIWTDGFGNPILSLENQSGKNLYHFYSRFDPAWSDLVWSDEFPKMMLKLVANQTMGPDVKYDKRILSDQQIMPVITNEQVVSVEKLANHIDLSRYIWLLLVLVFFAERWVAHGNSIKPILKNG